jgi:diketogulonate reductase-like aldo/keto reductase
VTELELHRLGIGTWENTDPEECTESVRTALDMGYRNVDTAQAYGNEAEVGAGIEAADVPREEVFLATKVWVDELAYDDVLESTAESLERLGTDYVDLLYVHWPVRAYDPEDTLTAFEEMYERGTIRHIGVSNFEPETLDTAREALDAPIYANQVELHPFLQQEELRAYAAEAGHRIVAYSPLARGEVLENDVLNDIAEKHDASPAGVTLAWLLSLDNVTAIPKATSEAHIRDNWDAYDVELDAEDHERIEALDRGDRKVELEGAPWLDDA